VNTPLTVIKKKTFKTVSIYMGQVTHRKPQNYFGSKQPNTDEYFVVLNHLHFGVSPNALAASCCSVSCRHLIDPSHVSIKCNGSCEQDGEWGNCN
jgi:hypothetical protein